MTAGSKRRRRVLIAGALGLSLAGSVALATSAFAAPGILTSKLLLISSGSQPFDQITGYGNAKAGMDESPSDDVVRSNDTFTVRMDTSSLGTVDGTTIRVKLDGNARWQVLPSLCKATGSALSADGLTVSCDIGQQTNQTAAVEFVARVLGSAPDGAMIRATATVEGEGVPAVAAPEQVSVTVSAAPRWDLSISDTHPMVVGGARNGVYGSFVAIPLSILDRGRNARGVEALSSSMTLSADVSRLYEAAPAGSGNWELVSCSINGAGDPVFNALPAQTALPAFGGIVCARNGGSVDVKLDGLDTSLTKVPTTTFSGVPVSSELRYAFAGKMLLFVPGADVKQFGVLKQGIRTLRLTSQFVPFTALSVSGQKNPGDALDNNAAVVELTDAAAGEFSVVYGSELVNGDATMIAPGRETAIDHKGKVAPGTKFTAQVASRNTGDVPHGAPGRICLSLDRAVQQVTGAWSAVSTVNGIKEPVPGARIQWGIGNSQSGPTSGCADNDASWYNDLGAVPGGQSNVDRVRWIVESPQPVDTYYRFIVELKLLDSAVDGAEVRAWGRISWAGRLGGSEVVPDSGDLAGVGTMSDRIYVIGASARIAIKTAQISDPLDEPSDVVSSVQPGEVTRFVLQPSLTDSTARVGRACPITVDLKLPAGMTLVDGSASVMPTARQKNTNGTTYVRWDLGSRRINERLPAIEIRAQAEIGLANGKDLPLVSVVTTTCDSAGVDLRTSDRTIRVAGQSAYRVVQELDKYVAVVGDQVAMVLNEFNAWSSPVRSTELIARLPESGDNSGSKVMGSVTLLGVEPSKGGTVSYTSAPAAQIDLDAADPTNLPGGATKWCLQAELGTSGCPAELAAVMGVRVAYPNELAPNARRLTRINVKPPQSQENDLLAVLFGAKADGLTFPVRSNISAIRYVAGMISGEVWHDYDRDGLQEPGDKGTIGAKVTLTGVTEKCGQVSRDTAVGPDGTYRFDNLCPGSYSVKFILPENSAFTMSNNGTAETNDSDVDNAGVVSGIKLEPVLVRDSDGIAQLTEVTDVIDVDAGVVTPAVVASPSPSTGTGTTSGPSLPPVPPGATPPGVTPPGAQPSGPVVSTPIADPPVVQPPVVQPPVGQSPVVQPLSATGTPPGTQPSGPAAAPSVSGSAVVPGGTPSGSSTATPPSADVVTSAGTDPDSTGKPMDAAVPGPSGKPSGRNSSGLAETGTPTWVRAAFFIGVAAILFGTLLLVMTIRRRKTAESSEHWQQ